jgi:hypothetical protein
MKNNTACCGELEERLTTTCGCCSHALVGGGRCRLNVNTTREEGKERRKGWSVGEEEGMDWS